VANDISFEPTEADPEQISFDPIGKTPQLSEAVSASRAAKATMGLQGKVPINNDALMEAIHEGHEDRIRADVASKIDVQRNQNRQQLITQKINQQGYITQDDINNVDYKMFKDDLFNGKIDPKSIFENHFASEYIKNLNWPMGQEGPHWYKDAVAEIPEQVQQTADDAVSYVKQYEYMLTRYQNIQAKIEARTPVQSIGAFALGLIPFREQVLQRGNIPYSGLAATTAGALEEQRLALVTQPTWGLFQNKFDTIVDNLEEHDLDTASSFVGAMLGQSPGMQLKRTIGDVLDLSTIPAGKIGVSIVRKAVLYNQMKTAFKDTAASIHTVGTQPIEAAVADGTGNLSKAATINTADGVIQRIQGRANPEKEAIDAMSSALKTQSSAVRNTPGRSGQEISNRIAENMESFGASLLDTIQNMIKVDRISPVLAARKAVDAIKERMRGMYVRLDNHILDQSEIYHDPFTNEYRSDTNFGQYDGTYFVSEGQANAWALQKGLSGGRIIETPASIVAKTARKKELENIMASPEFTSNKAIWRNKDTDIPVEIVSSEAPTKGADGKMYQRVRFEGADKYLPADELISKDVKIGGKTKSQIFDEYVALTLHGKGPKQAGAGWYYSMPQPVREREVNWLRNTIDTANTEIPDSMFQAYTGWLGWARTPEETLSAIDNWNRKAVIYGQVLLKNLYKQKAESLSKLYYGLGKINRLTPVGRKRADEFQRTLDAAIDHWDPDIAVGNRTPMNKGYWFKNVQELETFYQSNWYRIPDAIEIHAYFDAVQMHDMDWVVRNLELHKKMSQEGAMEYRIMPSDRNPSNFIPGIKRDVLPSGDDIIAEMGYNRGEETVGPASRFGVNARKEINDAIKSGQKQLIQVWNANHLPLSTFGGAVKSTDRVQYILADSGVFRERPLSFNQLPRRGGGHVDYDFKRSIKQAIILPQFSGKRGKVFQHVYVGDATVMTHSGPEIAGKADLKILNETRELLNQGKDTEAMASLSRTAIPWKDFKSWFNPSAYTDTAGNKVKIPARFSMKEPFYLVDKDKRTLDMIDNDIVKRHTNQATGKTTFKDGTREGSPAQQFNIEYAQQRDAYELMNLTHKGTRYNPAYGYGPANRIDPLTTLNRGLKRIINSSYMDDYKATAIGNWLDQAYKMGVFDDSKVTLNQIRSSPFYVFHNANTLYKKGFDKTSGDYHKLEIARRQTLAFVGEWSPIDAWVNNVQSKLENTIYGGGLGRAAIVPYYAIPGIVNAGRYLRAAVFHSTIGLFNWVQYLVQNMTYSTIFGIAGPNAAYHGWLGATLHNFGRFAGLANKDVGELLDRIAGRMGGWKPGELREARDLLGKTGFDFVGGEHVMMDHMLHPKVFQSTFGKFIDAGQLFFKAGERHARYGAWFTAYKEFRNGTGPWLERGAQTGNVSNIQLLEILNRADLLSGNMTTASKSLLQKGPFEFTTQFLSYTLRLSEQMTGKRLTRTEKARLFAVNGLLFGIPAAAGLGAFPFTDMFRQQAIQHRYVVGEHWYTDVIANGLPAFIGALISGSGDPSAGTYYNIGDRLGNPGLDIAREAMYGDKPFIRIMAGASGGAVLDGMYQLSGFLNTIKSFVVDGGESFPYTYNDVLDGARIIYSVNHAYGGFLAWNTGQIRSKKDVYLEPTSPQNAIWQTITGLSSQQASDFQRFKYTEDTEKQMQHQALTLFTKEWQRGLRAASDNDFDQANKYFARAKGILQAANYPTFEIGNAIASASDDKDLIMKINWNYYMRNLPEGEERTRMEDYAAQQQIRNKRIP